MNSKAMMAGAVLMALSKWFSSMREGLPAFRGIIEPVHVLPGRMRIIVHSLKGNPEAAAMLKEKMERLASVAAVTASTVTGSVCLRYDPRTVSPLVLFGSVIRLLELEAAIEAHRDALLWRELRAMGCGLNDAIHHLSHGLLDLKSLVGIWLLGIVIRDLLRRQVRMGIPGTVTIGWWAYQHLFPGRGDG